MAAGLPQAAENGRPATRASPAGEPLQRADLTEFGVAARARSRPVHQFDHQRAGLNESRLGRLKAAGLDSIQISFQADEESPANRIAGAAMHSVKYAAARMAPRGRFFADRQCPCCTGATLDPPWRKIIALGRRTWKLNGWKAGQRPNTTAGLPQSRVAPAHARPDSPPAVASRRARKEKRLLGRMRPFYFVTPDFTTGGPAQARAWTAAGAARLSDRAIPDRARFCPAQPAQGGSKNFDLTTCGEHALSWIWHESAAFNRFRGTEMDAVANAGECEFREVDFWRLPVARRPCCAGDAGP